LKYFLPRWWFFQYFFFIFTPNLGEDIVQMGWFNHQPEYHSDIFRHQFHQSFQSFKDQLQSEVVPKSFMAFLHCLILPTIKMLEFHGGGVGLPFFFLIFIWGNLGA